MPTVKGLTVSIGANVKDFNKGIRKMNRSIKDTKREVNYLERALNVKYDPKMFLRAQAQARNALEQTENKAKTLKKRLEYLEETGQTDTKHYEEIKTQLSKAEAKAVLLKKQLERINEIKFQKLASSLKRVGQNISNVGRALTRGLTMPIVAAGAAATKLAVDLDTSVRKVSTLFGDVNVNVADLTSNLQELAGKTGIAATELGEGLYQALSAGVDVTEDMGTALTFLETATSLAKAGFTTTEQAVDSMTSVMNAYGMETSEAARVSDILLATQNKGKTTVDELSQSLSQVIPTAANLGVSFEEVAASLAALTAQGVPTAQATTSLNQLLSQLGKSGTVASDILKNKTGKSFMELQVEGVGLQEVFGILVEAAEESDTAMIDLFTNIRSARGFMGLTANEGEAFADALTYISDSSGITAESLESVNGPAYQLRMSLEKLKTAGQQIGAVLMPIVVKLADRVSSLAEKFSNLSDNTKNNIISFLGIAAAIGPILTVVGKLTSGVGSLVAIIPKLSSGLSLLMAHPIIAVIGVVIGLLSLLYSKNEKFREAINNLVSTIGEFLMPILNSLGQVFSRLMEALKPLLNQLINSLAPIFTLIVNSVSSLLTVLMPLVNVLLNALQPIMATIIKVFGAFYGIIANVITMFVKFWTPVIGKVINGLVSLVNFIVNAVSPVIEFLGNIIESIFGFIKGFIDKFVGWIEGAINGVIVFINSIIDQINKLSKYIGITLGHLEEVSLHVEEETNQSVGVDFGDAPDITAEQQAASEDENQTPNVGDYTPQEIATKYDAGSSEVTNINNDYSDKDVSINVTVENYAEEVDVDDMVRQINIKLAEKM